MGYRAAPATGQRLSASAQVAGGPATGFEQQRDHRVEGGLTSTGEPGRISTSFGLDSAMWPQVLVELRETQLPVDKDLALKLHDRVGRHKRLLAWAGKHQE